MSKKHIDMNHKTILVTGSPGFIGANLVIRLLKEMQGGTIVSLDNMNDYYDPALKEYRLSLIQKAACAPQDEEAPGSAAHALVRHEFVRGSIADLEAACKGAEIRYPYSFAVMRRDSYPEWKAQVEGMKR